MPKETSNGNPTEEEVLKRNPTEKLVLASIVNEVCAIYPGDEFDEDRLLENARRIIDALNQLEVSGTHASFSKYGNSKTFSGLASTGSGTVQHDLSDQKTEKTTKIGKRVEERIGLYKVIKKDDGSYFTLTFSYFLEQVNTEKAIVSVGPLTNISYDREDHSIKGVSKGLPKLLELFGYKILWFKTTSLWGKYKPASIAVEILR